MGIGVGDGVVGTIRLAADLGNTGLAIVGLYCFGEVCPEVFGDIIDPGDLFGVNGVIVEFISGEVAAVAVLLKVFVVKLFGSEERECTFGMVC